MKSFKINLFEKYWFEIDNKIANNMKKKKTINFCRIIGFNFIFKTNNYLIKNEYIIEK